MTVKVAIADVVRDTVKLLARRKAYAAVAFLPLLALMVPIEWLGTVDDVSQAVPGGWWALVAFVLLSTFPQVAVFFFFISVLRNGESPVVPKRFLGKTGRVLLKELQVLAVAAIPGLLVLTAVVVAVGNVILDEFKGAGIGQSKGMQLAAIVGLAIGFGWLMLRLGAGIAGATVGEKISLKESWVMTRGHSLGLFLFFLPMLFVPALTSWVFIPEQGSYEIFSPTVLAQSVFTTLVYLFSYAGFSVWYVRLRERYEAMEPVEGAAGDKISPVAVVKEAVKISWARKGTLVGVAILGVMPSLLLVGIIEAYPGPAVIVGIVWFVCAIVVTCFVHTMLNHTAISQMRGEDDFFPKNMVLAMWRVFVRGLITYLGMALPMLIGMLPFILIILYGAGPGGEISTGLFTVGVIFAFIGWLAGIGLMLRLGVMVPGAATGRIVKVKEALAMTKGHVWRMVGSLVMTILPMIVLQILFVTVLGPSGGEAQDGSIPVLPLVLLLAVASIVSLVAFVTLPVWYEKLRLRQEAVQAVPAGVVAPPDASVSE